MKITLYGAAGDVTGSAFYVQTRDASLLVDCGIFQGGKSAELRNKKPPPVDYQRLDAIILTHAHLDHCGRLPLVTQAGYRGPIYATPATMEITALILRDSLKVQTSDLEKLNRRLKRNGKSPVTPLFGEEDVEQAIRLMQPIPYNVDFPVVPGVRITVREAGHILGSCSIALTATEGGAEKTIVFSGDLGPQGMPIVRDPEPFTRADLVFMESTYGDRDHKPLQATLNEADSIIRDTIAAGGKILVPSFAVGRTQDLLYYLDIASHKGTIPSFPIYLDSPMAIQATRIYMRHPELFDEEMQKLGSTGQIKRDFSRIHTTATPEESKKINDVAGPCMIIAGSGMCNAGRIQHHLRHNLWKPETSVMIVGYQAEGTLGRQLVNGAKFVFIYGERIAVRAQIHKLGGFSAHAGQRDLLNWFNAIAPSRPKVALVHGEAKGREALAKILENQYGIHPFLPVYGDIIEI